MSLYIALNISSIEFFPEVEPDLSKVVIYARGNLSVEEKNDYVLRVENIILNIQQKLLNKLVQII